MAAFNGLVFTSDLFGTTYALDAGTGKIVWKVALPPSLLGSAPCKLDNTYMLLGATCVRIADGTVVWTGPTGFAGAGSNFNGAGYVPEIGMFLGSSTGWNLPDPSKPPTLAWDVTEHARCGNRPFGGECLRWWETFHWRG